jgi:hypothetical protein
LLTEMTMTTHDDDPDVHVPAFADPIEESREQLTIGRETDRELFA